MSRPLRVAYAGAWYHVMNRGLARKNIFLNDHHRHMFLKLLYEIHNRYRIEIHAYCLMDNHYHLLIRTPLGNISRAMRHLDGIFTQRFNKTTKRDGPLFRGRYKSILVEADTYLLRLSRYIHLNPVEAKLVKKAEHYKWSSYRAYLSGKYDHWLYVDKTLNYFGDYLAKKKYKIFVEEGVDNEIDNFYKKLKRLPILGGDAFIKTVSEKYLEEKHKVNDIPEYKLLHTSTRDSINTIMDIVASFYHVEKDNLMVVNRASGNLPRAVGMYLSQKIGQYTSSEIASVFQNINPDGVLKACRRIYFQMNDDKQLKADIEQLERMMSKGWI